MNAYFVFAYFEGRMWDNTNKFLCTLGCLRVKLWLNDARMLLK